MQEEWRWIEGYEGRYEVSDCGRVRSHYTSRDTLRSQPRLLRPWVINSGYPVIELHTQKAGKKYLVHRLVAAAFVPNPLGAPHVNHRDSDRLNSNASNLEWVTRSENQKHACKFGALRVPMLRGEQCPNSKLTEDQVREIRRTYKWRSSDANQYVLAQRYHVDQQVIYSILHRKTWTHVI